MRSRNIKPGFFKNEFLAECDPTTRLLFIGLWCLADREGRMEYRPKKIRAEILPYDEKCNIEKLLSELESNEFILVYEVDNKKFIQIINFLTHQAPHYKENISVIPAPDGQVDSRFVAPALNESQKEAVYKRDGKQCKLCGAKRNMSIDHIIPRSMGGTNDLENLQVLCRSCNSSKNNKVYSNQGNPNVDPRSGDVRSPDSLIPDSLNLIPDTLSSDSGGKTGLPSKSKYLDCVYLTEDEHSKLKVNFPSSLDTKLQGINDWLMSTGNTKKSHYHTMLAWARKDGWDGKPETDRDLSRY